MEDPVPSVLMVDDKSENLLALEGILKPLGARLVRAKSGEEALLHLLRETFAVILLDVAMPEMDGFETARLIRQRKRTEHTPIIFVTGFSDEMLAAQGYALGAVDYILSPVVPDVLRTKVGVFVDLFNKSEQLKRQAEERVALAREQAARAAAEEAGFTTLGFLDQTYFPIALADPARFESPNSFKDRLALKTLLMPGGLGSTHKILILGSGPIVIGQAC